jgi:hypothetical protein
VATVNCEPCKTNGSTEHPQKEAEFLAAIHDRQVHRGGKTASTR